MEYDVAIVGGGPAGSWLARELAKEKRSVILFERSAVVGEPNFSSAGSPHYTVGRFNLPAKAVAAKWNNIKIIGPTKHHGWNFKQNVGVIFDFRELKKALLEEARAYGAIIHLGVPVAGIENRGGKTYVRTHGGEMECTAKIIVDASGPPGVIATAMGLREKPAAPSTGLEVIVKAESAPPEEFNTLTFFYGKKWAPHGYAWIFPMQKPFLKIGVGIYFETHYPDQPSIDTLLTVLMENIPWAKNAEIIEKHGSTLYWGVTHGRVKDNIIVIGDAADTINPLGGEGIRHALQSAAFAKEVILDVFRSEDNSRLLRYNGLWKKYTGWRWKASAKIADKVYPNFTDDQWDKLTSFLMRLSPPQVFDALFEYRIPRMWHVLLPLSKLLGRWVRH